MRATFSSALIVAAAVLALCSAAAARVEPQIVGGWKPIKDVSDPHIQELGAWAVSEHVKQANDGVRFVKVVSGEEQVVSGMNYKLVIEATDGAGKSATYGAAVYEQEETKTRQLLTFEPAN
jgi:accessory colonization factor AcfC